jgi:hypothetical protein
VVITPLIPTGGASTENGAGQHRDQARRSRGGRGEQACRACWARRAGRLRLLGKLSAKVLGPSPECRPARMLRHRGGAASATELRLRIAPAAELAVEAARCADVVVGQRAVPRGLTLSRGGRPSKRNGRGEAREGVAGLPRTAETSWVTGSRRRSGRGCRGPEVTAIEPAGVPVRWACSQYRARLGRVLRIGRCSCRAGSRRG